MQHERIDLRAQLCDDERHAVRHQTGNEVDVAAKAEIYAVINQLAESGAAILMISSELPEVLGVSDRVLVMRNGRLVKELVTRETSQEEIMRYATLSP